MSMRGELRPSEGKLEIPGMHGGGGGLGGQSGQEGDLGWRFDVDIVKAVYTEYSGYNQPHWEKRQCWSKDLLLRGGAEIHQPDGRQEIKTVCMVKAKGQELLKEGQSHLHREVKEGKDQSSWVTFSP